ncbi:MAG: hypothetical protein AAF236_13230 [Verrucomicrobiota bacterium]
MNPSETFELEADISGKLVAEIESEDSLALDNRVFLVAPDAAPISVAVVAEQRYFYESSILAFEQAGGPLTLVRGGDADVSIHQGQIDGGASLRVLFAPAGESSLWESLGEEIAVAVPRAVVEDHPALRHVDVESMLFGGAREIVAPEDAIVLVESEAAIPLVYQTRREGSTTLVVNLDPVAAEFYFSAWFPTLVFSASTTLAGREEPPLATYRVGDSFPIPGARDGETSDLVVPGALEAITLSEDRWGPAELLGFYDVESPGGQWSLSSSLLSLGETGQGSAQLTDSLESLAMGRGIPYWLIAICILLLTGESILYHRRKVG